MSADQYQRPVFTWLNPCKPCPSHWYPEDPESRDIRLEGKEFSESLFFPCAWRDSGYCTGQSWKHYEDFGNG